MSSHDTADLDGAEVSPPDHGMALLACETLGRGEGTQSENVLVSHEVGQRHGGPAVAANHDVMKLVVEDHSARLGDRFLDARAHVSRCERELVAFDPACGVRLVERDLHAKTDRIRLSGEVAAVHVDQPEPNVLCRRWNNPGQQR